MYDRDLEHPDVSDACRWGYPRWMRQTEDYERVTDSRDDTQNTEDDDINDTCDEPYYDDLEKERR